MVVWLAPGMGDQKMKKKHKLEKYFFLNKNACLKKYKVNYNIFLKL